MLLIFHSDKPINTCMFSVNITIYLFLNCINFKTLVQCVCTNRNQFNIGPTFVQSSCTNDGYISLVQILERCQCAVKTTNGLCWYMHSYEALYQSTTFVTIGFTRIPYKFNKLEFLLTRSNLIVKMFQDSFFLSPCLLVLILISWELTLNNNLHSN